jgi:hypothetical protein
MGFILLWTFSFCLSGLLVILKLFGLQYSWVIAFSPVLGITGLYFLIVIIAILCGVVKGFED